MFTGIIEEIGKIITPLTSLEFLELQVQAPKIAPEIKMGDSLALNGVCLTVIKKRERNLFLEVMPATLKKTNLGQLKAGEEVNLEQALRFSERVGGHFLTGHVDGVGVVTNKISQSSKGLLYTIEAPESILPYLIPQGSIAVDGISLTIVEVTDSSFSVSLLPYTAKNTTLDSKKRGSTINLEADLIGKYIAKFMTSTLTATSSPAHPSSLSGKKLTLSFLQEKGFTEVKKNVHKYR